jgi:hypothetical protein
MLGVEFKEKCFEKLLKFVDQRLLCFLVANQQHFFHGRKSLLIVPVEKERDIFGPVSEEVGNHLPGEFTFLNEFILELHEGSDIYVLVFL